MTREKCRQCRLLTWTMTSYIGQFVHPVGVEGVNRYFSQLQVSLFLEKTKIWCNIQVIIYLHINRLNVAHSDQTMVVELQERVGYK